MSDLNNIIEETIETDSQESSISIKLLKLELQECKTSYEHAYARAYLGSPVIAKSLGLNATKDVMTQIATNDPEVKTLRQKIDKAQRKIVEAEASEKKRGPLDESYLERHLSSIFLEEIGADALEIFVTIKKELNIVSQNLKSITEKLDNEMAGIAREDYWREDVLENASIYKFDLGCNIDILRKIFRQCGSEKHYSVEIKLVIDQAKDLRDDCRTLIDLAKINLRGY